MMKDVQDIRAICFQARSVSMASRRQMEDSECWWAVGRIEAGPSITDDARFFGVHHTVIS